MSALSIMRPSIRTRLARIADGLAIAVAVSLPWSSSVASLLILLWLLALVPTLDPADVRQEIATPAGGLPVALFVLSVLGMTWADVSWAERLRGLESLFKLLMIPLLLVQFRRSDRGLEVMAGYLASCTVLVAITSTFALWPRTAFMFAVDFSALGKKAAGSEFITCIFVLLFLTIEVFCRGRRGLAAGMLVLALVFLANIFYIALGPRSWFIVSVQTLGIIPILLVLLGFKKFSTKTAFGLLAAGLGLSVLLLASSPYLQNRTVAVWENLRPYPANNQSLAGDRSEFWRNLVGDRSEWWRKSLSFIQEAPVLGHGTGSIHELFVRSAVGQTSVSGLVTNDPYQQTLAVGIQVGLVGVAVLWAMWVSHLLLFRGNTLPEWIGLVVVTQNIVGSLLGSHLFNFPQGWVYVFGVGVAGGMVRRLRAGG